MMFKLPRIGDKIELTRDWYFILLREHRNNGMISRVDPTVPPVTGIEPDQSIDCTLPVGTILEVTTVTVTKRARSVTFTVLKHPGDKTRPKYHKPESWYSFGGDTPTIGPEPQKLTGAKFWVSLECVENIQFEYVRPK